MLGMTLAFNIAALVAVCATGAMHWFGIESSLYWIYPWWDIPTHILGGLTAGLWAAAVASRYKMSVRHTAILIIGFTLAVGVAWELWELLEGLSGGWLDSIKDIIDDVLGGTAAWLLYVFLLK